MFHYAKYRGDELIVLGYDRTHNACMVVKLIGLPGNEQEELKRIASSSVAQNMPYLAEFLNQPNMEKAGTGETWFTYLVKESTGIHPRYSRRNGPVFRLPLKEIQDSLDPEQRSIFKGYSKGIDLVEKRKLNSLSSEDRTNTDTSDKLDKVLSTIVDENRRTQQLMLEMIKALSPAGASVPTVAPKAKKVSGKRSKKLVEGTPVDDTSSDDMNDVMSEIKNVIITD